MSQHGKPEGLYSIERAVLLLIRKELPRPRHLQLDASLVLGRAVGLVTLVDAEGLLLRRVGVVDVVEQHLVKYVGCK